MKHCKGFVFGHIYLIQDAEASVLCGEGYRTRPEGDLIAVIGVRSYKEGSIHIDMEGNIPYRPHEEGSEVIGEYVFTGGLRPCKEQVLSCEDGGYGLFPGIPAVVKVFRLRYASCKAVCYSVL